MSLEPIHISKLLKFFKNYEIFHLQFLMASPTSWEFYKEVETKILWVNICTQDLEGVATVSYTHLRAHET